MHARDGLEDFVRRAAIAGAGYTVASAAIWHRGETAVAAAGWLDAERRQPASDCTLFDFASLTKPFVATLATALDERALLSLDARLGELWPAAPRHLAATSCADLLSHRSGLRAWVPLYALCPDRRDLLDVLADERLAGAPPDTYSDLGYVLWGALAERALGRSVAELLAGHLGELADGLRAQPVRAAAVAGCALGTGKEVELAEGLGLRVAELGPPELGQAQDGNARFLGGVPGHAGLFGTIDAVLRLGRAWLHPHRLPTPAAVARALAGDGELALGWSRRQPGGEPVLSSASFGHTGFVGGSLWVDPARGLVVALLGHRADPFLDLAPLRRELHRIAVGG